LEQDSALGGRECRVPFRARRTAVAERAGEDDSVAGSFDPLDHLGRPGLLVLSVDPEIAPIFLRLHVPTGRAEETRSRHAAPHGALPVAHLNARLWLPCDRHFEIACAGYLGRALSDG